MFVTAKFNAFRAFIVNAEQMPKIVYMKICLIAPVKRNRQAQRLISNDWCVSLVVG
jgi:hypothetical protein